MKKRAFLLAIAMLAAAPTAFKRLFNKPKRHSFHLRSFDELKPGMKMYWSDRGKSGVMTFIRPCELGELWTGSDGKVVELNNRWGNKWWATVSDNQPPTVVCVDCHTDETPKMEFFI